MVLNSPVQVLVLHLVQIQVLVLNLGQDWVGPAAALSLAAGSEPDGMGGSAPTDCRHLFRCLARSMGFLTAREDACVSFAAARCAAVLAVNPRCCHTADLVNWVLFHSEFRSKLRIFTEHVLKVYLWQESAMVLGVTCPKRDVGGARQLRALKLVSVHNRSCAYKTRYRVL